jgi:basic membrane lipoprotein Med (substrate-binding protein (PBP1-ABC) superfamily)
MSRIALVVPRSPPGIDDPSVTPYVAALERARRTDDVQTKTFAIDPSKPVLPESVRRNIGSFGLVLLAGPLVDERFVHVMALHPHTRFAVIDPPNPKTNDNPLYKAVTRDANATDVFFATGPSAYLAGYLGVLMAKRRDPGKRQVVVSMIASDQYLNQNEFLGFTDGAAAADPRATVLVNYTDDASDPAVCERIANRQIDKRSTVVYADAGACSPGALSAVEIRGVWGMGANQDVSGPGILASTVKRLGPAVDYTITYYLDGTLPKHHHLDIGIERGAVDLVSINAAVPSSIRAKLSQVRQQNMARWAAYAAPLK